MMAEHPWHALEAEGRVLLLRSKGAALEVFHFLISQIFQNALTCLSCRVLSAEAPELL